jgi:beta-glucosidase
MTGFIGGFMLRRTTFLSALVVGAIISSTNSYSAHLNSRPQLQPLYKDPSAPIEQRVEDLLGRMTLEEKVAQLTSVWQGKKDFLDSNNQLDMKRFAQLYPDGIGQYTRPNDVKGAGSPRVLPFHTTRETVELVNVLQHYATERTRLGIPMIFHEEALHGYQALGATAFPQAIGLASTWDPELVSEINSVIAREVRARGVSVVLSPVVDVARDPRWGRIEETFGEDPYLVGEMGVAAVTGLQGENHARRLGSGKVFATLKHLTGHGQPESGNNTAPAPISQRELRENFFPPFEEVVKRTGISVVMPSFNEIDGMPSHANKWLLTDVLRGEWGYQGAIFSDYDAIGELRIVHHIAGTPEEAAIKALTAGVDADLPDGQSYKLLVQAVRSGHVSEDKVDAAVRRVLSLKFRAGLFEHPYADVVQAESITNNDEAKSVALRAAQRTIVLLKNDGALPLSIAANSSKKLTIAVIGPNAAVARLGGYYSIPPHSVSLLEGIKNKVGDRANILFAQGVKITDNDDWWADEVKLSNPAENHKLIAAAVDVAKQSDVIVLAIGDTEQTSREGWASTHLGDRTSLDLVGEQIELFRAMKATGKPVIVTLINGRPLSTVEVAEKANALLECWYLGEQGGNALANVLFGDINPGGKLPVTIARNVGQLPMFYNYKPSAHRGYLFDTAKPLFPFGWGLSYTTFAISDPKLSSATIATQGTVTVSVEVRNTGARSGDETVQLYIHQKVGSVTRPVKLLKAFKRVTLQSGEHRTISFNLNSRSFAMWNDMMQRVVEPGEYEIMVGPNSVDLKTAVLRIQ